MQNGSPNVDVLIEAYQLPPLQALRRLVQPGGRQDVTSQPQLIGRYNPSLGVSMIAIYIHAAFYR
jgi:hypothetical protein